MQRKNISNVLVGLCVVLTALQSPAAYAFYGIGKVGKLLVGIGGVRIELIEASFSGWPCATPPRTDGFRYSIQLTTSGAKELFAGLLSAKVAGTTVQVVGLGTCTTESTMEDVQYIVIEP